MQHFTYPRQTFKLGYVAKDDLEPSASTSLMLGLHAFNPIPVYLVLESKPKAITVYARQMLYLLG